MGNILPKNSDRKIRKQFPKVKDKVLQNIIDECIIKKLNSYCRFLVVKKDL